MILPASCCWFLEYLFLHLLDSRELTMRGDVWNDLNNRRCGSWAAPWTPRPPDHPTCSWIWCDNTNTVKRHHFQHAGCFEQTLLNYETGVIWQAGKLDNVWECCISLTVLNAWFFSGRNRPSLSWCSFLLLLMFLFWCFASIFYLDWLQSIVIILQWHMHVWYFCWQNKISQILMLFMICYHPVY